MPFLLAVLCFLLAVVPSVWASHIHSSRAEQALEELIGGSGRIQSVILRSTTTFGAAGVAGLNQGAFTITLSGADPTTYATFYGNSLGPMTLVGTNANQTVTTAAGLVVLPPIKSTNVAVTALHGILIPAQAVSTAAAATGLTVNAPTGATNNYAARFNGKVGMGTNPSAPAALQIVSSGAGIDSLRLSDDVNSTFYIGHPVDSVAFFSVGGLTQQLRFGDHDSVTYWMTIAAGNVGILTTSPTNILSLSGQSARTIWMERHTTANTAGNALTVQAGGATSAATDKNGGTFITAPGVSTGTGRSWAEHNCYTTAVSTGTSDNTSFTCEASGVYLALTDGIATNVVNLTLANDTASAVIIYYAVEAKNATDMQIEDGFVICRAYNDAGVVAGNTCTETSTQTLEAGTLATTWAISAANPAVVSVNADTSLTPSTGYPRMRWYGRVLGHQAMAVQ